MSIVEDDWCLSSLPPSPFYRRLPALLAGVTPPTRFAPIDLSLGEPAGDPPRFVRRILDAQFDDYRRYAPSSGTPEVKRAFARYLGRRYGLAEIDPEANTVHVAGTREALFMLPLTVAGPATSGSLALVPDPSYPAYEAGARAAGFTPLRVPTRPDNGFLPDYWRLPSDVLDRVRVIYFCSPSNPHGAVASPEYLFRLVSLARSVGALLIVDECYADLYDGTAPGTVLRAALDADGSFAGVVATHSLSKRSSLPGLRSGFVAGDAAVLARLRHIRENGAVAAPRPVCAAAAAVWDDDDHVDRNRAFYRGLIDIAEQRLGNRYGFRRPAGGFFLWLDVGDGEAAARRLWADAAVKVIPGRYLATPDAEGVSCGDRFIRLALVRDAATIGEALGRLTDILV